LGIARGKTHSPWNSGNKGMHANFNGPVFVVLFIIDILFNFFSFFLQDPCRPGVKDAVQLCTSAGVKVLFNSKVTSVCACAYMYG
jgi:hypothetical protein